MMQRVADHAGFAAALFTDKVALQEIIVAQWEATRTAPAAEESSAARRLLTMANRDLLAVAADPDFEALLATLIDAFVNTDAELATVMQAVSIHLCICRRTGCPIKFVRWAGAGGSGNSKQHVTMEPPLPVPVLVSGAQQSPFHRQLTTHPTHHHHPYSCRPLPPSPLVPVWTHACS